MDKKINSNSDLLKEIEQMKFLKHQHTNESIMKFLDQSKKQNLLVVFFIPFFIVLILNPFHLNKIPLTLLRICLLFFNIFILAIIILNLKKLVNFKHIENRDILIFNTLAMLGLIIVLSAIFCYSIINILN